MKNALLVAFATVATAGCAGLVHTSYDVDRKQCVVTENTRQTEPNNNEVSMTRVYDFKNQTMQERLTQSNPGCPSWIDVQDGGYDLCAVEQSAGPYPMTELNQNGTEEAARLRRLLPPSCGK